MDKYPNFDIKEFLETNDIEFKEADAEGHTELSICCLNKECNDGVPDQEYKLWINGQKGMFVCYRCGLKGSVVSFVMKVLNCRFENALRILSGSINKDDINFMTYKLWDKEQEIEDAEEDAEAKEISLPYSYEEITGPIPYLKERGIPWRLAAKLGWGVSTSGYTKNRLIVPTYIGSRLVFWQARDMLNKEHPDYGDKKKYRKVLNPTGASARHVLYNYDIAKDEETIVLTEGFTDCVKVGTNAMATNGKKLHAKQVELLRQTKAKTIVILWDRDAYTDGRAKDGKKNPPSAIKAGKMLRDFFNVKFAILPDKKDPGDYKLRDPELMEIIRKAKEIW